MAELDSQQGPAPETLDSTEQATVIIIETVPANRPRKVSAGMFGPLEIAAVSIGALAVVAALAAYFLFVMPSSRELAKNKSDAERLEAEQISAKSKYGEITSTETQVGKLVGSVDDFETRFLPMPINGQTALYQRINGLIAAYGLVNTSGPAYAPLETADLHADKQSDDEKGRAKYRSLYPGVYVSATLEGSYQNLRRFIREIETGREFIIVSSVELAPSDSNSEKDKNDPSKPPVTAANTATVRTLAPPVGGANRMVYPPGINPPGITQPGFGPTQPKPSEKGKMHGEIVSLHIELAAYFRRPSAVPVTVAK